MSETMFRIAKHGLSDMQKQFFDIKKISFDNAEGIYNLFTSFFILPLLQVHK